MNSLQRTQVKFQDYLVSSSKDIQEAIVSTAKVPAATRLAIYSDAYQLRLIDALVTTYPALYAYLGSEEFEKLAHEYIKKYPSTYRSIRWFGDKLAEFLIEYADYKDFEHVSELATIEWIMTLVFDARDSTLVTLESMQSIPVDAWANMRLIPHPSVHCLTLSWNSFEIWQAIMSDEDPPDALQQAASSHWVVWRHALENQYSSLEEEDAFTLQAMCRGDTFGELCEGLCRWQDVQNAPLRAASLLKGWIIEGLIESIQLE